jgi:hypothetical protein
MFILTHDNPREWRHWKLVKIHVLAVSPPVEQCDYLEAGQALHELDLLPLPYDERLLDALQLGPGFKFKFTSVFGLILFLLYTGIYIRYAYRLLYLINWSQKEEFFFYFGLTTRLSDPDPLGPVTFGLPDPDSFYISAWLCHPIDITKK